MLTLFVASAAYTLPARPFNAAFSRTAAAPVMAFNSTTAVLAAGFAFEAYNEPSENDARWERGADGIDVAFMSETFAQEVYKGILEVRLCEAKDLEEQDDLAQKLMSGGQRDPYVILAMNEENEEGPKEGAIGLGRAVDRVRSSTSWSTAPSLSSLKNFGKEVKKGCAEWPQDEVMYLYVKDPSRAQLALTVFDEEVLAADIALGATSLHLNDLISPGSKKQSDREWEGWVKLTWRPAETQDNTVMMGTVAGAALGGPVGAAAGGFIGSLIKKPVQGELRLKIKYTPLEEAQSGKGGGATTLGQLSEATDEELLVDVEDAPEFNPKLASGAAIKGASEGVDWSTLARRVGRIGEDETEGYELCCFLTHTETSSECAIWRSCKDRLLVVAFRGTSDIMDVLTDVQIIQTPLERGYNGQKSDDPRKVHAGFFASAEAINRRLKELLIAATAGTAGEWQLLITGHSLGGAVATLLTPELVGRVDTSRGFKEKADASWLGIAQAKAKELLQDASERLPLGTGGSMKQIGSVELYTFGAPRVGNSEFVSWFNEVVGCDNCFRVVNDRDVVPRLPRGSNAAGAVLDYEHVGRTVLIAEKSAEADGFDGFWVEGTSDEAVCPLRGVSPLSNPLSSGTVLGDVADEVNKAGDKASAAWTKIEDAGKAKSREQLQKAVNEGLDDLGASFGSIADRFKRITDNPLEAVSLLGLDKEFVESEVQLAQSLASGDAVIHHLEPQYYVAMTKALDAALDEEVGWIYDPLPEPPGIDDDA